MFSCLTCDVAFQPQYLCKACDNCLTHCTCESDLFDADELGLDPDTDNTPRTESRHA